VKLIVGLGNPGPGHAHNRHNVGYQCIERLVERHGLPSGKVMFKAFVTSGHITGVKTVLARPLTFMNLSGQAVRPLLRWYRIELVDLLVIYDDLDLPLGRIRLRQQGGSGGHKGMRSIIEALGTEAFPRLRVGIGRPLHGEPPDHVLSDFTADEWIEMDGALDQAVAAVETFVATDIRVAMNSYNVPPEDVAPDAGELAAPTPPTRPTPPTPPRTRGAVAGTRGAGRSTGTRGAVPPKTRDGVPIAMAEAQGGVPERRGSETEQDAEPRPPSDEGALV
jgi:PTH1 family peptidyl-tRNA hydrolase